MVEGFRFLPEYFPPAAQKALVAEILAILEANPLYRGAMPRTGAPLSVRNTNLGPLGWVSDIKGYRYQPTHPETGQPWTPIPQTLLDLWADVSDYPHPPQACLVNWYEATSRLGLHIDADETAKDAPSSRSRSARARCSASAASNAPAPPAQCASPPAMSSSSAANPAAPITALTASTRTAPRSFPGEGASTSPSAA